METGKKAKGMDLLFLMTVGVFLAWSVVAAIIDTTVFSQDHLAGFIRMFFVIGLLRLIVSHKYFIWASAMFLVFALFYLAAGFFTYPPEPSAANETAAFIREVAQFLRGEAYHTESYERAIVWAITISAGLFVMVFTHVRFQFFLIFAVTAGTFSLLLTSRLFTFQRAFDVFAFCLVAYLIKYLTGRNAKKAARQLSPTAYALPMAALCVGAAFFLPTPPEGFTQTMVQTRIISPFQRVNDTLITTSRTNHFTMQQVGFGSAGGRLGGDVTLGEGVFMRIRAQESPQPIYLTGRIFDTYTGYSWVNSLEEPWPLDFNETEQNLALYERALSGETALLAAHLETGFYAVSYTYLYDWEGVEVHLGDAWEIMNELNECGGYGGWIHMDSDAGLLEVFSISPQTYEQELVASFTIPFGEYRIRTQFVSAPPLVSGIIDLDDDTYRTRRIDIGILEHRTRSMFHTGIVQEMIPFNVELTLLQDPNGHMYTRELMPRHTWYTVLYSELSESSPLNEDEKAQWLRWTDWWDGEQARRVRLNISWMDDTFPRNWMPMYSYRGVLADILRELRGGEMNHGANVAPVTLRHNGQQFSYEELLSRLRHRAAWIHETYTVLPEEFPERIRDLALAITSFAANDYERARLLEAHLSENFTYTLTPGMPPPDRDFADHFLFDLQKGYCTYFATAFVVMARSIGLPARYVEGFVVRGDTDAEGFIPVLNRMAHAWGEVYFEGYGWKRFEPTPPAGLPEPHREHIFVGPGGGMGGDDFLWEMDQLTNPDNLLGDPVTGPGLDTAASGETGEEGSGTETAWGWRVLLTTVLLAAILFVLLFFRALWIWLRDMRAREKENGPAVLYYFGVLLKYMRFFNFEMQETETAVQFTQRVAQNFGFPNETFFPLEIAETFGKARYSPHEISREERRLIEAAVRKIDATMRSYTGMGRYLVYKYILAVV